MIDEIDDDRLDGTPLISPNCWSLIEEALRTRNPCRYLEWGSGNSTLAVLRTALANPDRQIEILSIEDDLEFATAMLSAFTRIFREMSADGVIHVQALPIVKPTVESALKRDPAVANYEARFLRLLWYTRNDHFWSERAQPGPAERGPIGAVRRLTIGLQCSVAFRYEKFRRMVRGTESAAEMRSAGTVAAPELDRITSATRVTFISDGVKLEYLAIPRLRNQLWRRPRILDGLYLEYADYVSAELSGRFDVILVDGRARTSCLKRVHHEELLSGDGVLFVHDAGRPSHIEGLRLFNGGSYVTGIRNEAILDRELFRYDPGRPSSDDLSP